MEILYITPGFTTGAKACKETPNRHQLFVDINEANIVKFPKYKPIFSLKITQKNTGFLTCRRAYTQGDSL